MKLPSLIEVIRGCSDWEYKMFQTCKENTRPQTKGVRTKGPWTINFDFGTMYPHSFGDIRPDVNGDVIDPQAIGRFVREYMEANPIVHYIDHPPIIREPQINGFSIEDRSERLAEMLRDFRQSRGASIVLSDVHFPITNLEP